MKSDFVKTGPERAPHRSLFNALGYRTTDIMSEGKKLVSTSQMGDLIIENL